MRQFAEIPSYLTVYYISMTGFIIAGKLRTRLALETGRLLRQFLFSI